MWLKVFDHSYPLLEKEFSLKANPLVSGWLSSEGKV